MPIQTYKASKAYASNHVSSNLWLWIAVFTALTVISGFLMRYNTGSSYTAAPSHWGDAAALFGMILGGLVMIKSQEGYNPAYDDNDEGEIDPVSSKVP